MTDAYARVALPLPLHNGYLYHIPEPLRGSVTAGMRVVVPVRGRELIGLVVRLEADPPPVRALDLLAVPDAEPLLTPPLLATAEWVAGYYGAPLGLALRAALPAAMWGESKVIMRLLDASLAEGAVATELVRWLAPRVAAARCPPRRARSGGACGRRCGGSWSVGPSTSRSCRRTPGRSA